MNEAETRAELIDPALKVAGWGVVDGSRARLEMICPGRVGSNGKGKTADYVLTYKGHRLAVIEAKAVGKGDTAGLGQAKDYAGLLQCRFAFSTNGKGIYRADMATGQEGYVDAYPSPQALWDATFAEANAWRDRFAEVPVEEKGGSWSVRYYQHNAIDAVLEAIAKGDKRILLALATGTGKTAIAFQLAWKLFHAKWNISGEPTRRPRILFLADRNILADQAYNAFSAFPDDALARITAADIRKKGRVPKNASIFFTIFQTFMVKKDSGEEEFYFGDYPPDFFDFIVIDECHRGGANDESAWRAIMEHFAPAVQLGLTATPKRQGNVDTYAYFGEPVYTYSLKEGIEDGFLTPFKVRQVKTSIDDYTYTPDDEILSGEADAGDFFDEGKFNRAIIIPEREAYRVRTFLDMVDQKQKTLVFCASQPHAAMVRDLVSQMKTSADPNYCVRVTSDEGGIGDTWLRAFQDNEKTIPTVLTTSHKLSTGVDARNVRNIVLMRPIKSMIEFKQIIGRGTRLYEGKDYFTIVDFVDAYQHFSDPEWDSEPMEPPEKTAANLKVEPSKPTEPSAPSEPREPLIIKLADGKVRKFQHISATSFWGPDGKPMSAAQFVESLFGVLPQLFKDEAELRKLWGDPETRKRLLEGLAERGFTRDQLNSIRSVVDAEASDLFDVLAYVAYVRAPVTREERAATHRSAILDDLDQAQQEFLGFVLSQYVVEGEDELDPEKLPGLLTVKYGSSAEGLQALGGSVREVQDAFRGFQGKLYDSD